jgi:hypothetical protein
MTTLSPAPDKRSQDLEAEVDIPLAFRRAFQPTLLEQAAGGLRRAQHSVIEWFERQPRRSWWLPRAIDPVAELKHVWLGDYGLLPSAFDRPAARRGGDR